MVNLDILELSHLFQTWNSNSNNSTVQFEKRNSSLTFTSTTSQYVNNVNDVLAFKIEFLLYLYDYRVGLHKNNYIIYSDFII